MIFYVFLDGIGFGENNPDHNPFARFSQSFFEPLAGRGFSSYHTPQGLEVVETDASMGIPGLPQSATGQTSLWTGVNAPQAVGRHVSGFPTFTLKKIIAKHSILKVLNDKGLTVDFLNCYTPKYFDHVHKKPKLVSASTLVQMASGRPLKTLEDLREKKGIYMDINHEILRDMAREFLSPEDELFQPISAFEVGKRVFPNFQNYDLCLYEYFLTDKVGHAKDWNYAEKVIQNLEDFFRGILSTMNPEVDQLIVTSDHGNLEDLRIDVHTKNPVPTFLYGKFTLEWKDKIKNLSDIPKRIYEGLGLEDTGLKTCEYPI